MQTAQYRLPINKERENAINGSNNKTGKSQYNEVKNKRKRKKK
jgi:hypothetical protein